MEDDVQTRDHESAVAASANSTNNGDANGIGEESLRNDVYTAAAYGDLEKLQRLVECEGCSVSETDGLGYYALQWAALNNRTAAAQYIIEVVIHSVLFFPVNLGFSLSNIEICNDWMHRILSF